MGGVRCGSEYHLDKPKTEGAHLESKRCGRRRSGTEVKLMPCWIRREGVAFFTIVEVIGEGKVVVR